jgi:hypothetical protein
VGALTWLQAVQLALGMFIVLGPAAVIAVMFVAFVFIPDARREQQHDGYLEARR